MTATPSPVVDWVIYVIALAGRQTMPGDPSGLYVRGFDPEAHSGRGEPDLTSDPAEALGFPDAGAAAEFWRQPSRTRPFRPDGKPNRPLTAYTVEIVRRERNIPPEP